MSQREVLPLYIAAAAWQETIVITVKKLFKLWMDNSIYIKNQSLSKDRPLRNTRKSCHQVEKKQHLNKEAVLVYLQCRPLWEILEDCVTGLSVIEILFSWAFIWAALSLLNILSIDADLSFSSFISSFWIAYSAFAFCKFSQAVILAASFSNFDAFFLECLTSQGDPKSL